MAWNVAVSAVNCPYKGINITWMVEPPEDLEGYCDVRDDHKCSEEKCPISVRHPPGAYY